MTIHKRPPSRRDFLERGAAGLAVLSTLGWPSSGCQTDRAWTPPDAGVDSLSGTPSDGDTLDATPECLETADDIEGPYYKADAPFRSDLTETGLAGTLLVLSGRVLGTGCQPIGGALLDFWQADDAGQYDGVGFRLRGRLTTRDDGTYGLRTILPGRYGSGGTYRPRHIHVKANRQGGGILTTQLYFPEDPWNASDPFFKPSLLMGLRDNPDGSKLGTFDFVLV